jgi:hypothetical protein
MEFLATLSPTTSLTGYKPPGSSGESIRVGRGGPDPRVADADLEPSGDLHDRIEDRASPKSASELRAATILVEHLNSLGAAWANPRLHEGREAGVDAVAEDGDKRLRVQVTTPERTAWEPLAKGGEHVRSETGVQDAVKAIRAAIEAKTLFAELGDIVLALDATDSPRYALQGVVDAFRGSHGTWTREVGYAAVWLVGPGANHVHRLDTDSGR